MKTAMRRKAAGSAWTLLAIGTAIACFRALAVPLNHDVGWHLYIAGAMLDGAELYRDLIEVNPPLIDYLMMPLVWLSNALDLSIPHAFKIGMLSITLGVIAALLRWTREVDESLFFTQVLGAGLVLGCIGLTGIDFGQREHVMVVLVLPAAFVAWRRIIGQETSAGLAWLAGASAGLGFALKPHFGAIWLALEVLVFVRAPRTSVTGSRARALAQSLAKPETLGVVAVLAVYWILVLIRGNWLPVVQSLAGYYEAFLTESRAARVFSWETVLIAASLISLIRLRGAQAELARVFVALAVGAWIALVVQAKGWTYQEYPVWAWCLASATVTCHASAASRVASPRRGFDRLPVVAVFFGLAAGGWIQYHEVLRRDRVRLLSERLEYFDRVGTPESLLVVSHLLWDGFPLINYANAEWASPHPAVWWAQAVYGDVEPEGRHIPVTGEITELERTLLAMAGSRFQAVLPDLVLVDTAGVYFHGEFRFPFIEYLNLDPSFRAAFQQYEPTEGVGTLVAWSRRTESTDTPRSVEADRRAHQDPSPGR